MAECKWCGRSGWFLRLSPGGLCTNCLPLVNMDARQRGRIINDSMKILNASKNLETRLSRLDLLVEHARALVRYEERGISVIDPPPSAVIGRFGGARDEIILECLRGDVDSATSRAAVALTTQAKVNALSKVLLKVREYRSRADNPEPLGALEKKVSDCIHKTQLEAHLDSARKAEFKGQKKRALDEYYEALYLLKHDEIDDSLQKDQIGRIESKIAELGGSVG